MKAELPLLFAILFSFPVAFMAWRKSPEKSWLSSPPVFLSVWLGLFLLPYVIFGPSSFLWMDDEGDLLVPHTLYLATHAGLGQYSHLLGSMGDLQGSFLIGGELLSPERLLMAWLPMWLAIAAHKALTCLFGFMGTYWITRRMGGAPRPLSLALAAIATVSWYRMVLVTYSTGMTLAIIPLGVYLLVGRIGRRWYWPGIFAYAMVAALWSSPHQGALAIPTAVLAAMIWLRVANVRPLVAIVIVMAAVTANWSESIFAMLQLAGDTQVGSKVEAIQPIWVQLTEVATFYGITLAKYAPVISAEILSVLVMLGLCRRTLLPRALLTFLFPVLVLTAFQVFPWQWFNLASVRNASAKYILYAVLTIAPLMVATAYRLWTEHTSCRRPVLPILALVTAFAISGWYVGFELITLFYRSGQAHYNVENLRHPDWWNAQNPSRVVSIRGAYLQPEPNLMLSYGLPFFDAWLNLQDRRLTDYWSQGIKLDGDNDTRISFNWNEVINGSFHISKGTSLPLLAAANVGFIVSGTPLTGDGLKLMDGPPSPQLEKPSRSGVKPSAYYRDRFNRIFNTGKMYIYALPDPVPRVWAPHGVEILADDAPESAFLNRVATSVPARIAVLRAKDAALLGPGSVIKVKDFELVPNGFTVDVDAPKGGYLVINAVASRFFQARAENQTLPIVNANGIQMAMNLPAGTRHVTVCYQRPTLYPRIFRVTGECGAEK